MRKLCIGLIGLLLIGCVEMRSSFTGVPYNSPAQAGYLKVIYDEQETGPGLVLIKGGYFDYTHNSVTKEVLMPSFYMDETEVTNAEYKLFINFVRDSIARDLLAQKAGDSGTDGDGEAITDYAYKSKKAHQQKDEYKRAPYFHSCTHLIPLNINIRNITPPTAPAVRPIGTSNG